MEGVVAIVRTMGATLTMIVSLGEEIAARRLTHLSRHQPAPVEKCKCLCVFTERTFTSPGPWPLNNNSDDDCVLKKLRKAR